MAKPLPSIVFASAVCAVFVTAFYVYQKRDADLPASSISLASPLSASTQLLEEASHPHRSQFKDRSRSMEAEFASSAETSGLAPSDGIQSTLAGGYFESLSAFSRYLDNGLLDQIDLDRVVGYVTISDSALELVARQYQLAEDPAKLSILGDIISESRNPLKVKSALSLLSSSNAIHRQHAYRWLQDGVTSATAADVSHALLNASHHELDANLLTNLLNAIPSNRFLDSPPLTKMLTHRLYELAMHPSANIASAATSKLADYAPTEQTLHLVHSQLQSNTQSQLVNALEDLKNFESANTEVMLTLESLLSNPDLSQHIRANAAKALIVFENSRRP